VCISEHIEKDPADAIRIHLGFNAFLSTRKRESKVCSGRVLIQDVLTELNQITAGAVQDERIGLDACDVQHRMNQPFHGLVDHKQVTRSLLDQLL
jgi:hypothetical protein